MRAAIAAVLVLAPVFGQQDPELARVVDRTVSAWAERNSFKVTAEAQRAMQADAQALRRVLVDIEAANPVSEKWSLVATLIRHYCFELRDSRLRGRTVPSVGMAFQASADRVIDLPDVKRSTLREVLERIFDGLRPKPVGYIEFRSTPDRAEIVIAGQPRGFTNRVYVISTGAYQVEIRRIKGSPCRMRLTVQPAATAIAACDS